jgi:hypothetical protein
MSKGLALEKFDKDIQWLKKEYSRISEELSNLEINAKSKLIELTRLEKLAELNENISEEEIAEFMLDHDYIVKMRPVKEYKIRVKVVSIEKAYPRIVEPEGIDED